MTLVRELLAILIITLFPLAVAQEEANAPLQGSFTAFDADGDGLVTRNEFGDALFDLMAGDDLHIGPDEYEVIVRNLQLQEVSSNFETADVNGDDVLTDDQEFIPGLAMDLFGIWNTDGDDVLSEEEFRTGWFVSLDASGDNVLTSAEFEPAAGWFETDFVTLDTDADAELSMDEFMPATGAVSTQEVPSTAQEEVPDAAQEAPSTTYGDFDTDASGDLTTEEFTTGFGTYHYTSFDADASDDIDENEFTLGLFGLFDTNDDQTLTQDEFDTGTNTFWNGDYIGASLSNIDDDSSGDLTQEEFVSGFDVYSIFHEFGGSRSAGISQEQFAQAFFNVADTDDDEIISEDEFDSFSMFLRGDAQAQDEPFEVGTPLEATTNTQVFGSFRFAESCSYDADRDLYVITNAGIFQSPTDQAESDGYVSLLNPDGTVNTLKWIGVNRNGLTLNDPLGSDIMNGRLYLADIDTVRWFDMSSGEPGGSVTLEMDGVSRLNDLEVAEDGTIYVSQHGTNDDEESWRLYQITPDGEVSIFHEGAPLARPNGVAFDSEGNIVVVNLGSDEILTFSPDGELLSTETSLHTGNDGLVVLSDDTKYVSSVQEGTVAVVVPGEEAKSIASGIPSAASMCYDPTRNRLIVPMNNWDAVSFVELN